MSLVRLRLMPTVVAVSVTALLGSVIALAQGIENSVPAVLEFLFLIELTVPFVVPVVWAWAFLVVRPHKIVLAAATFGLVAGWVMMPKDVTLLMITLVITGLVGGLGLIGRWKPEILLLSFVLISVPLGIVNLETESVDEVFSQFKELVLQQRREFLMAGANSTDQERELVKEEQILDDNFLAVKPILPGSMVLAHLIQSALTLGLMWILVKVLGYTAIAQRFLPFGRWRLPFAVVWLLAVAVALMIVQPGVWPAAGVNLAIVIVGLLAVQGAAVQWRLSKASFPMLSRLFFLIMAILLLLPLVMLGLADQWLDLRKLNKVEPEGSA